MTVSPRPIASKCSECGAKRETEPITVRVYRKRVQFDYRYRMCLPCVGALNFLLGDRSINKTRRPYWEPDQVSLPEPAAHGA